jgi:hypothetical protein
MGNLTILVSIESETKKLILKILVREVFKTRKNRIAFSSLGCWSAKVHWYADTFGLFNGSVNTFEFGDVIL